MSEEEIVSTESGAETSEESPSSAETTSSESKSESLGSKTSSAPSKQETKEAPFHEHPRFKELINQRNELNTKYAAGEKAMQEMRAQLEELRKPKSEDPNMRLYEKLKAADPVFAEHFKQQVDALKELQGLKSWKDTFEQKTYLQSARAEAEKLKTELKITDREHQLFLNAIPGNTPLDKIGLAYRNLAQESVKDRETAVREAIAKYSKEKKAASNIPVNSKGSTTSKAPNVNTKTKLPKDPEERKAYMTKLIMGNIRAETE